MANRKKIKKELDEMGFFNKVKSLFPNIIEETENAEMISIIEELEILKERSEIYKNLRSLIGGWIAMIYHNATIVSEPLMKILKDIVFSLYYEKNYGEVKIYPISQIKELVTC